MKKLKIAFVACILVGVPTSAMADPTNQYGSNPRRIQYPLQDQFTWWRHWIPCHANSFKS